MNYELINQIDPNISPIEQVLVNRGFKLEDIPHYLNVSKEDNLPTSFFNNLDSGIKILMKHIMNKDASIHVQVD